jgi:glycosyltransferase involved in cell wall biosynthesis
MRMVESCFVGRNEPVELEVLLPFHNPKCDHFEECIDSLNYQTFRDFRIIFIDDHGTDFYDDQWFKERVKGPFTVIRLLQNLGVGGALNEGVKAIKAPFVARMDSDDINLPERFDVQLKFLREHQEIGMIGCQVQRFGSTTTKSTRFPLQHAEMIATLPFGLPFIHPTLMFRREALGESQYNEDIPAGEGVPLWAELAHKGVKMANVPLVLFKYRMGAHNTSLLPRAERAERFKTIQRTVLPILFGTDADVWDDLIASGALTQLSFMYNEGDPWISQAALKDHAQNLLDWCDHNSVQFEGLDAMQRQLRRRLFWNRTFILHKIWKVFRTHFGG